MGLVLNKGTPGTREEQCLRQSLRGRIPQLRFHTTPIVSSNLGCDILTSASQRIRFSDFGNFAAGFSGSKHVDNIACWI